MSFEIPDPGRDAMVDLLCRIDQAHFDRLRGEWFKPSADLLEAVASFSVFLGDLAA